MGACTCEDGEHFDMLSEKDVRARKPHRCYECGKVIEPGQTYHCIVGVCAGEMVTMHTCRFCVRVRADLADMGYCVLYGGLWELVGQIEREEV